MSPAPPSPPEPRDEEAAAAFEICMRQAAMEFDALDNNNDGELDFAEFSQMIRDREVGVHSERALQQRFDALDLDGGGTIDATEYIRFAVRDSFLRSAASLRDIFKDWDEDGNGFIDRNEVCVCLSACIALVSHLFSPSLSSLVCVTVSRGRPPLWICMQRRADRLGLQTL